MTEEKVDVTSLLPYEFGRIFGCVVKERHESKIEEELNLKEEEKYLILHSTSNEWWFGINKELKSGWIPCSHVVECNDIETHNEWTKWVFSNWSCLRMHKFAIHKKFNYKLDVSHFRNMIETRPRMHRIEVNKGFITTKYNDCLVEIWNEYIDGIDVSNHDTVHIDKCEINASQMFHTYRSSCCYGKNTRVVWLKLFINGVKFALNVRLFYQFEPGGCRKRRKCYDLTIENVTKSFVTEIVKDTIQNALTDDVISVIIGFLFINENDKKYSNCYQIFHREDVYPGHLHESQRKPYNYDPTHNDIHFLLQRDGCFMDLKDHWITKLYSSFDSLQFISLLYPFVTCGKFNALFDKERISFNLES